MLLTPGLGYRYAFKQGMRGTDVAALQINLAATNVDGIFGDQTRKAVRSVQKEGGLVIDGIAGLVTQQRIVLNLSAAATTAHDLPEGLLRSICANESGFALAAYSRHPSDEGFDLGAFQRSSGQTATISQKFIADSYNVWHTAESVATGFASLFAKYRRAAEVKSDRRAWELAALSHNWPAAADNLANLGRIYKTKPDDVAENWIEVASGGRLHTAKEWVASYIEKATIYVAWD